TAHGSVGFVIAQPHIEHRPKRPGHAREHGVHSNGADAQAAVAGSTEGRTGIKSKPTKGQDEAAGEDDDDVMGEDGVGFSRTLVLAKARANDHGNGERGDATTSVYYT